MDPNSDIGSSGANIILAQHGLQNSNQNQYMDLANIPYSAVDQNGSTQLHNPYSVQQMYYQPPSILSNTVLHAQMGMNEQQQPDMNDMRLKYGIGQSVVPMPYSESELKDNGHKKRRRTNYKDAENSARLAAGLNMLISPYGDDGSGQKDLKTVSKLFGVPYNTLRDNYLK